MGIVLSCCASCVAGACCSVFGRCKQPKRGPLSRLPYLFILILSGLFATIMSLYGEKKWDLKVTNVKCDGCTGNGSVFRVSLVLFVFECIHVALIGGGAVAFHYSWFPIKFLLFICGVVLTFFIGTYGDYENYATFARYVPSPIYLFIQALLLISCTYDLNDSLRDKGNTRDKRYFWILISLTIIFYVLAIVLIGLFYAWFVTGRNCPVHETLISTTLVLIIINCLGSMWFGRGTLFISAVVSLYVTFLLYASMSANNDEKCNQFAGYKTKNGSLWIGVGFALVALSYAALKANLLHTLISGPGSGEDDGEDTHETPLLTGEGKRKKSGDDESSAVALAVSDGAAADGGDGDASGGGDKIVSNYDDPDLESNVDGDDKDGEDGGPGDEDDDTPYTLTEKRESVYFHFIMALAAAYMAMLLTNWATNNENGQRLTTSGRATQWANMALVWLTEFLFLWTLVAPKLCPGRFEGDDDE